LVSQKGAFPDQMRTNREFTIAHANLENFGPSNANFGGPHQQGIAGDP